MRGQVTRLPRLIQILCKVRSLSPEDIYICKPLKRRFNETWPSLHNYHGRVALDVKGFRVTHTFARSSALFSSRMGHGYHGQGTPTCAYQLDREELNKDHRGVLQFARVMLVLAREKLVQRGLEIETDSQDGKIIKFVGYLVFVPPFFSFLLLGLALTLASLSSSFPPSGIGVFLEDRSFLHLQLHFPVKMKFPDGEWI